LSQAFLKLPEQSLKLLVIRLLNGLFDDLYAARVAQFKQRLARRVAEL
jgi:hypothetical protein